MSILDDSLSSFQSSDHHHSSGVKKKFPKGTSSFVVGAITVVAVFAVAVSVQLAQRSQENRQQASVANGQVLISNSATPAAPGQQMTVTLKANTQGVQIDGIQLGFTITPSSGQTFTSAPTVTIIPTSGMNAIITPIVTAGSNGAYNVIFGVAPPIPNSFSSTTPVDFATVAFTTTTAGTVNIQFSTTTSKATVHDSPNADDTLMNIQPMSFVIAAATNTPTNTPIAQATSTVTNTPTRTPTNTPTRTPTLVPSNTLTLTPTRTPTTPPGVTASVTTAPTVTQAGGTCNSIMISYANTGAPVISPRKGDSINFTCGVVNGAFRYEFRLREPGSNNYITLVPISTGSRVSQPYTITQAGDFSGQCRMCTGSADSTCQAWE